MSSFNAWELIRSKNFLYFILFYTAIFYLNFFIFLPKLFIQKKYILYSIILVFLFIGTFYLKPFEHLLNSKPRLEERQFPITNNRPPLPPISDTSFHNPPPNSRLSHPPGDRKNFDIVSIILFLATSAASGMIVLTKNWRETERKKTIIENEKINAELSFLKMQISPHFLFNTLNNIYALAIIKSENTAPSILQLSNLMRFVTDEAKENYVAISKEISCISNYVALQKLRLGKNTELIYETHIDDGDITVAPLILIPFIENVFKHGISNKTPSKIIIRIQVKDGTIHLFTSNNIFKKNTSTDRKGVGLQNVQQRLEHLYPSRYKLDITATDSLFTVNLFLNCIYSGS